MSLRIINTHPNASCNEDVTQSKPNPEIYLKAAAHFNVDPTKCIVFEDSVVGKTAATNAGCQVISVKDASDITIDFMSLYISKT